MTSLVHAVKEDCPDHLSGRLNVPDHRGRQNYRIEMAPSDPLYGLTFLGRRVMINIQPGLGRERWSYGH
jgi:hypothetical protein